MLELCAVAFGGALGAVGRYAVGLAVAALAPEAFLGGFPVATLIANVFGCFVIGVLSALFEGPFAGRDHVRLFAVTGVLGGFTTFSTFSLETVQLLESGAWRMAGANAAVSLGGVPCRRYGGKGDRPCMPWDARLTKTPSRPVAPPAFIERVFPRNQAAPGGCAPSPWRRFAADACRPCSSLCRAPERYARWFGP